jgi:hypothetical protein
MTVLAPVAYALLTASSRQSTAAPAAPPVPLAMPILATLSGTQVNDGFEILDTGDVNGDGATDFVAAHAGEASGTRRYLLVLGRKAWAADASRTEIDRTIPILLPQTSGLLGTGVPDGRFEGLYDVDGDGVDDVVVTQVAPGMDWNTMATLVYLGGSVLPEHIDVPAGDPAPDLAVTQQKVPHDLASLCMSPLPAVLVPGDVDGDGNRDLVMFDCTSHDTCTVQGPGHLYVITFGATGMRSVNLNFSNSIDPDVSVHGGTMGQFGDRLGCRGTAFVGGQKGPGGPADDFDGDGRLDLLVAGGEGVYLFTGRDLWPPKGEIETLATEFFDDASSPAFLDDLDGDGLPEIKLRVGEENPFQANESIWFSRRPPGALRRTPDLRLVSGRIATSRGRLGVLPHGGSGDLDGNGVADLTILVERARNGPAWEWRGFGGPVSARGQIRLSIDPAAGDFKHTSSGTDLPAWWPGDFDGDGTGDVAVVTSTERGPAGAAGAGVIRIYRGPLDGSAPPTAIPSVTPPPSSSPTPSATASHTPIPPTTTPTEMAEPTASPSPTEAEAPRWSAFMPLTRRDDAEHAPAP